MYAPWPQEEPKEQKTAEAKTEEQVTKGTEAEGKQREVRPPPLPPHSDSQHAHELANPVPKAGVRVSPHEQLLQCTL